MEIVEKDGKKYEYIGAFKYDGGTVHRYCRIDTPEEEKREIIMGIKKVCAQYKLRKQKEAEEQKRKEQEEKKDAGDNVSRGTENIG